MATAAPTARRESSLFTRIPTDDTLPRWRAYVSAHPIGSSLLAGAVATQFATVFGIWFRGFGLPVLNWPTVNGQLIIPTSSPGIQYFAGAISHFADGVFFALLFALLFHPFVPLRNTMLGNLIKALLYGTVLAIISAAWWVPAVYVPHHAGFLSRPRLEAHLRHLPVALDLRILPRHRLLPRAEGSAGTERRACRGPVPGNDPAGRRVRLAQVRAADLANPRVVTRVPG